MKNRAITIWPRPKFSIVCAVVLVLGLFLPHETALAQKDEKPPDADTIDLPIDQEALLEYEEVESDSIRNQLSLMTVWSSIGDGEDGLSLDLTRVERLLDGSSISSADIYGKVYVGPYPFEAAETGFAYKRFRTSSNIDGGTANINVGYLLEGNHNSEDWTDMGTAVVRLELFLARSDKDRALGIFDTFVAFRQTDSGYQRLPWIVEGPLVNLAISDHPSWLTIQFVTDTDVEATIILDDGRVFESGTRRRHEVQVTDLLPGHEYHYQIRVGDITTKSFRLRAAPNLGNGPVTIAYCGDSREGVGGGVSAFMGINHDTLQRLAALAYAKDAQLFIMGGDLINGYTTDRQDFAAQLHAWKQAMSGFWHERPVFPAMGNHEALLRVFRVGRRRTIRVDRWPYQSDSAEALFADAFVNPSNGPQPSDPRRPPYRESVFSFHYGLMKIIAFNNNYWYSGRAAQIGGSPEGYILDDQMRWIEQQLHDAEVNSNVKYVLLYAQEPVFPCGGHIRDAMWHNGNNNIRAHSLIGGRLYPARDGMLEVRNRFARAVAASSKVAAVLCSDEHSFYRVLIHKDVPIGDPSRDDKNGDGIIDWEDTERATPLDDLKRGTWYMTCGGGGAPYYSEERIPWNAYWKKQENPRLGYFYSSQENILIFRADQRTISVQVFNPYGERVDHIADLMKAR